MSVPRRSSIPADQLEAKDALLKYVELLRDSRRKVGEAAKAKKAAEAAGGDPQEGQGDGAPLCDVEMVQPVNCSMAAYIVTHHFKHDFATALACTADAQQGPKDRFKVVKIDSAAPCRRGRWTVIDFADRPNPMPSPVPSPEPPVSAPAAAPAVQQQQQPPPAADSSARAPPPQGVPSAALVSQAILRTVRSVSKITLYVISGIGSTLTNKHGVCSTTNSLPVSLTCPRRRLRLLLRSHSLPLLLRSSRRA